ncbi:phytoene/squalene synthase family protein [Microbacterium paludicola]|uniref:phytoene/squalene synthase family protein n=1 Tax=Microbacterium paludicola TaxID=300019 RepID=UPI0014303B57|nr:squalene/phytoene synthase family protein [Microbacterium paludicola]MBF0817395.1 squalene/phytoene synthase family protein [Microbacterium paludicola]
MTRPSGLDLYTRTARMSSARVIGAYSTSFGLASRLLPRDVRGRVADVYALVRVADEVVDGPATEAGLPAADCCALLDELEEETLRALARGFSANLVVHAFAVTARETGIGEELLRPFFASMRTDAEGTSAFDPDAYRTYIHGSAEVVGSMCLRVFATEGAGVRIDEELEEGARRLGAAFQKVNFLRDLRDDVERLGRVYLPGVDPVHFTEEDKNRFVQEIDDDLAVARRAIVRLPPGSRRATSAAAALFGELNDRVRQTPADELRRRRISVPTPTKVSLLTRAALGRVPA